MSHDYSEQVALLALDALPETERHILEDHLAGCRDCQTELDELRSVAAGLVADEPPSDLTWRRIQNRLDSSRPTPEMPAKSGPTSTWMLGIAAAAALILGVLGAQVLSSSELGGDAIVAAAEEAAESADSIVGDFVVGDETVARIVVGASGQGFVVPEGLEPLDTDRTYQLWVFNDKGEAVSAGVLGSDPDPAVFTWTAEITGFALTREIAGGVISSAGDVVSVISDV